MRRRTNNVLVHELSQKRRDDNGGDSVCLVDNVIEDIDHEQLNLLGQVIAYYLETILEELFDELVGFRKSADERAGLHVGQAFEEEKVLIVVGGVRSF